MPGGALLFESGRFGCDSQMVALARLAGLDASTSIGPIPPRIVISTGPERVAEATLAARAMGVPAIAMGQPGNAAPEFDLVVTTPQFRVAGPNVLRIPISLSIHEHRAPARNDALDAIGPYGAVLVGGPAGPWTLDDVDVDAAIGSAGLGDRSVVVLTSPRTPALLRDRLRSIRMEGIHVDRVGDHQLQIADVIASAGDVRVTAESVSMISESIAAGRKVALVPLRASDADVGEYLDRSEADPISFAMPGDLPAFWAGLALHGPIEQPSTRGASNQASDLVRLALADLCALRRAA